MTNVLRKVRRQFLLRRQQVFCFDNIGEVRSVLPEAPVSFLDVTYDNVDRITQFRAEKYATVFRGFLDAGQLGLYAEVDSRVVGHAWAIVCRKRTCLGNGYLRLRSREAMIHFCRVEGRYRGQSIYPAMLAGMCNRLFERQGASRIFIDTEVDNMPALRAIKKVGPKPIGAKLYFQFRGRLIFYVPLPPMAAGGPKHVPQDR